MSSKYFDHVDNSYVRIKSVEAGKIIEDEKKGISKRTYRGIGSGYDSYGCLISEEKSHNKGDV